MIVFLEFFIWLVKKLCRHLTEFMTDHQLGSMAILAPIFIVPCSFSLRVTLTAVFLELTSLQDAASASLFLVVILWNGSIFDITATAFPKLLGPLKSAVIPVFVHVSTLLVGNTVDFWWHPTQLMPSEFCGHVFDAVSFITALAGNRYFADSNWAETPAACPSEKDSYSLLQDFRDYAALLFCISLCLNIGQRTRIVLERRLHGRIQARIQALLRARIPLPSGLPKLISSFRVFYTTAFMCEGALAIISWHIVAHARNDLHCGILRYRSSPVLPASKFSMGFCDPFALDELIIWLCVYDLQSTSYYSLKPTVKALHAAFRNYLLVPRWWRQLEAWEVWEDLE